MKSLKFFSVAVVCLAVTGCTCRTAVVTPPGGAGVPVVETPGPLNDINFAFDSYKLDATAKGILDANAAWLKDHGKASVEVEGHCDERGTNEYNLVLGANRARSAYDYLRGKGVETTRMSTKSYGEDMPLDPRHNEEAWAKNRRDHFRVTE